MAGHSKFANIRHRKEKNDSARAKVFTRLGREIAVSVRTGGADPAGNARLRDAIAKAKAENMPNDTIERSIKKAAGDVSAANLESVTYEGYGPGGVAIIVDCLTDNRNRAAANVRNAFTKGGGSLGSVGCVSFMFETCGQILLTHECGMSADDVMLLSADAGAREFLEHSEGFEILTDAADFSAVRECLEQNSVEIYQAEITRLPQTYSNLATEEQQKQMNKILDLLSDEIDVQNVYHNAVFP